jgi:phospholipid transport system substrate-binding protein
MRFPKILTTVFVFFLAVSASRAVEISPTDDLRKSIDAVIQLLGNKSIERNARRTQVGVKIREKFDFEAMGRFILGQNWRAATPEQRAQFVEKFGKILENTYMNRIEAYTDEKVRYVDEKRVDDKAKINTIVVSKTNEIPIEYKVYLKNGGWYVYDVTIEGVSLVRNYQETYTEIHRKEGMNGLLKRMSEKIVEMETAKAGK